MTRLGFAALLFLLLTLAFAPAEAACVSGATCLPMGGDVTVSSGTASVLGTHLSTTAGIAAAGSTQGTATALTTPIDVVTTVAAGTGVALPSPAVGQTFYVANQGANPLSVYPPSGAAINALSANVPLVVNPGTTTAFLANSSTAFITISGGGGVLQACTSQGGAYTIAYSSSTACPGGSDAGGLIPETAGAAVTINQSTASYFPVGTTVGVFVPLGYPAATVVLGSGASLSPGGAPLNSSGALVVPSGGAVQLSANASSAYVAIVTSPLGNSDSLNSIEGLLGGNQIVGGSPPLSANWTATHATLSGSAVAGGPLGTYSVFAEDNTTNFHFEQGTQFQSQSQFARLIIVAQPEGTNTRFLNPEFNIGGIFGPLSVVLLNAAGNCATSYVRPIAGNSAPNWLAGPVRSFKYPGWSSWCVYEIPINLGPSWNTGTGNAPLLALASASTADANSYAGDGASGFNIAGIFWGTWTAPDTNISATPGNDSATAGNLGEVQQALCPAVASQTATFTNGSANIVLATAAINVGCPVNFTNSGGALPTNFAAGTNYYVISLSALTITVAAAPGGTAISAGSAGSGTQSAVGDLLLATGTAQNFASVFLSAGNWNCWGNIIRTPASTMSALSQSIGQTSATLATGDPSYVAESLTTGVFTSAATEARPYGRTPENVAYQSAGVRVYATVDDTFASTATAAGNLICQRPR